ncbi:metallophosphoesterase family protein [Azomonas macrocytogenes]|uniref:Phosphoesterase n=1 Tax=Azomonas macrocytogenes TaxID=69962 RepID=A0A839T726_AZOMA|nr:metallophosphoesterase family protein [Azomonas macrocytogenes]MBB3103473.1 hypothetical protein [Azomonas macrocytogenes]
MPTSVIFKIGVISDTHGLLRPEAIQALRGCDRLIHAGDIGRPEILDALAAIAPLSVIRGNNDEGEWAKRIPLSLDLLIGGLRIHVLHDLNAFNPASPDVDVVIAGHSHKPTIERKDGVLYFNPGSAGPRRFKLPISMGYLHLQGKHVRGELVTLG